MVTACGWAKHGDRISICNSPDCFVAIRPNGLSPWSDGPLGNQVSFAAADGGVAQSMKRFSGCPNESLFVGMKERAGGVCRNPLIARAERGGKTLS